MTKHLIKVTPFKKAFFCDEEQTVLDAALSAGLPMPHSCRSGNCGRCMAQLLSGKAVYRSDIQPPGITNEQSEQKRVLLCQLQARSALNIEAQVGQDAQLINKIVKLPARIVSKTRLAADVLGIKVQLPRSQPLQFKPGQYVDLLFGQRVRRSYSIASLPSVKEPLEFHIRRVPNGQFSDLVFKNLDEKHLLKIQGPYGEYGWRPVTRPVVLVAGGTGYAPIQAMLREWQQLPDSDRQTHSIHLFWGARDRQDIYDRQWLRELAGQETGFRFTAVVEKQGEPSADQTGTDKADETGWVHECVLRHYPNLESVDVYASGPPDMVDAVRLHFPVAGAHSLVTDSFDHA